MLFRSDALIKFGASPLDFQRYYLNSISDTEWRRDEGKLLFDDLVKVLNVAGFTKGFILCDGLERMIQSQSAMERRDFAESLRYFFVDGLCENSRISFYSLLLTIHPYSQELLNPHWNAAGLDRFAPLSGGMEGDYTVYIHPLNQESAIPLAKVYLDAARISEDKKQSIEPFTQKGLNEALTITSRVPGKFLNLLHMAIEKAISEAWNMIDVEQIRLVNEARVKFDSEKRDGQDVLPPNKVKLGDND